MTAEKARRPSPLQRSILIALAVLDERLPGPVATRDLERLLEQGGDKPVYGPNLRSSCRRLEATGLVRTLRAKNLQLAVGLTDAGRELALPLLTAEREAATARRRAGEVRVLPADEGSGVAESAGKLVNIGDNWFVAWRADFVVRLNGGTCLQLWDPTDQVTRLEADPLQVAQWLQVCHDAGLHVRVQINESTTPQEGMTTAPSPADQTDSWYRQLDSALQALGISGLTDEEQQAVVTPGEALRSLPAPARLLHILRESPAAFPLTASSYEEDTGATLEIVLSRAGFTAEQAQELRVHRIRWPLMSEEAFARRELNHVLDELARRQLYCNRERLITLVFSPVSDREEPWVERLRWLLGGELAAGFGFRSGVSRQEDRALSWLAGYTGQEVVEKLAGVVAWAGAAAP